VVYLGLVIHIVDSSVRGGNDCQPPLNSTKEEEATACVVIQDDVIIV
jgi:hypothetical protein